MIDKFKQGYLDEARELLGELESALLELDEKRDDPEIVGRAFRALHTIKGSGAMFGFDDIAGFAHNLEAVFDQLRMGKMAATSGLINLTLACGDQIKTMLDAPDGLSAAGQDRSAQLLAELRSLTGTPEPRRDAAPAQAAEEAAAEPGLPAQWRVHFRPGPDLLRATTKLVTTERLGKARVAGVSYENADGSPLQVDTDYFGKARSRARPTPGPFEQPGAGPLALRVW